jgi:hypothetical protein
MYLEPRKFFRNSFILKNEDHSDFLIEKKGKHVVCIIVSTNKMPTKDKLDVFLMDIQDQLQNALQRYNVSNDDLDTDAIRINTPEGTFAFPVHNSKVYSADRLN